MAQRIAEAAVDMRRHIGSDVGHRFVASADCGFGNAGKAALDSIQNDQALDELVIA